MLIFQEKYECALNHSSIKIVTPEWILDSVAVKSRKDEVAYHPRLTYQEEEDSADEYDQGSPSDGSYIDRHSRGSSSFRDGSPMSTPGLSPKHHREGEIMFDDSSDSSPEKEDRNLNWTPAEMSHPAAAKRRLQQGKETGLINLCANVPPVPGTVVSAQARSNLCAHVPSTQDARSNVESSGPSIPGVEKQEVMTSWNPAARTLRNITNSADIQQVSRPSNVAQVRKVQLVCLCLCIKLLSLGGFCMARNFASLSHKAKNVSDTGGGTFSSNCQNVALGLL